MISDESRGSAKIYTFPPRGRFAVRVWDVDAARAANVELPHGARLVASTNGWYHDDAIRAEEHRD